MYFSDRIILKKETVTYDGYGAPHYSYVNTSVWANKRSVTRAEFYSANTSGIDAKIAFQVNNEDYNNESEIEYNNKEYSIIRTFQKDEGTIELICSDKDD